MQQEEKLKYLKVALIVFGVISIAGIYVMMWVWPAAWFGLERFSTRCACRVAAQVQCKLLCYLAWGSLLKFPP